MQSIIAGGISWGMGEDAIDESANEEDIDWKVHALKNSLTDKQQKLVDKIRYFLTIIYSVSNIEFVQRLIQTVTRRIYVHQVVQVV